MSLIKRIKYEYLNACGTAGGDSTGFYEFAAEYRAENPEEVMSEFAHLYKAACQKGWSEELGKSGGMNHDMMLNGEPMPQELVTREYTPEGKLKRRRKLTGYASVADYGADYFESQGHANDAAAAAEEKRLNYLELQRRCKGNEQMLVCDLVDEMQDQA